MATIPKLVNIGKVTKNFRESLERRTGITNFASDSIVRSIYLPVVSEIQRMENENRRSFEAFQIDSATGKDLELIAANYGLQRLLPTFAETYYGEMNFYFYCDSTFGSLNNGNNITVPQGTKVKFGSTAGINDIVYETTQSYTLQAGSKRMYCQVRALTAGMNQNVNKNSLVEHNFTDYANSVSRGLKCNNLYPIINGSNIESDDSLRYRIVTNHASIVKDSEDTLFLRSLEVPGLIKLVTIPNYYGIGTVGVFVFGASNKSTRGLVRAVERKLEYVKAPGVRYFVLGGVSVYIDLDITIYLKNTSSSFARNKVTRSINRALSNFFTNSSSRQSVSVDEVRDVVLNADNEISGVISKSGSTNLFDSIYVRKSFGEANMTSERVQLLTARYSLKEEEFFNLGVVNVEFEVDK